MTPTELNAVPALPEGAIRDIANGLNGVQPPLGQWRRDLMLARAVEAAVVARDAMWAEKLSQAEQDAGRYRWLRENCDGDEWWVFFDECGTSLVTPSAIDAAIDAQQSHFDAE